jgi:hypothetical protein
MATCYAELTGLSPQAAGPPAQLYFTCNYAICDTLANTLENCDSSGGLFGSVQVIVDLPATLAQIQAAAAVVVQGYETSYPGLLFVWSP